jgi:hypothetical protein
LRDIFETIDYFHFFKSSPSRQQEQNKDNSQYRP